MEQLVALGIHELLVFLNLAGIELHDQWMRQQLPDLLHLVGPQLNQPVACPIHVVRIVNQGHAVIVDRY